MVCIYCASATEVVNSRLQKRQNHIWRRRKCVSCGSIFTTHEFPDLANSLRILKTNDVLVPFSRDHLYISIYEACRHRADALQVATPLADTVITKLLQAMPGATLRSKDITAMVMDVLGRFDKTAATIYAAYHRPGS